MIIHVFTQENPYSYTFLQLFSRYFDTGAHLFIFKKTNGERYSYPDILKDRILFTSNLRKFFLTFSSSFRNCKQIYFHYLPYGPSLFTWLLSPELLRKSTWIMWGGDVSPADDSKESIVAFFYELMRKSIIKRIPRIAGLLEEDYEIVKKIYNTKASFSQVFYPYPINFSLLSELKTTDIQYSEKTILLGNSATLSNNHLDMLAKLEPLKNEQIKILCPLSYGSTRKYAELIAEKGKEIFRDKFVPMLDFIEPAEYSKIIAGVDVVIMNHHRQQGLGNLFPLLFLEKKVYIRSDASSFNFLKGLGCTINDTLLIDKELDSIFVSDKASLKRNSEIIYNLISEDNCVSLWKSLLNAE
jgi:dTDP-N-acetylfucosamine:lipid II N-acetylfucosaminyltransferase